jgi:metal-responsive CopG/Arc/MetJ family transcriptional regulator
MPDEESDKPKQPQKPGRKRVYGARLPVQIHLDIELINELDQYCAEHHQQRPHVISEALRAFLPSDHQSSEGSEEEDSH